MSRFSLFLSWTQLQKIRVSWNNLKHLNVNFNKKQKIWFSQNSYLYIEKKIQKNIYIFIQVYDVAQPWFLLGLFYTFFWQTRFLLLYSDPYRRRLELLHLIYVYIFFINVEIWGLFWFITKEWLFC